MVRRPPCFTRHDQPFPHSPLFPSSQRFWFEHQSGKRLYPDKLRDLRSGRVAFRVAPGAAGANKVENQTQIDNEEEVFRHVFGLGWSVRMRSLDGSLEGLY